MFSRESIGSAPTCSTFSPKKKRTQDELVEAQEARVRYAMLSSELQALPEEEKRMAALALARPAILLDNGKLKDPPENWAGVLKRYTAEIGASAGSTGLVINSDRTVGTGFIVAPGVMMTARHVIDAALHSPNAEASMPAKPSNLCLGSSAANCIASLELGDVLYPKEKEESRIALVELRGHDPDLQPPLSITDPPPAPNEVVGNYVYVIGYPFRVGPMPEDFVKRLLGQVDGQSRLMPGRVLAFGSVPGIESHGNTVFTTDISTTSGTGGGPLIDLKTGKVIGVSYAGVWKGERGKFAYAAPIPRAALDIINQRNRGAPEAQGSAPLPGKQPGN
jgi:S1-C subfamily serine protease